jgi:hypothetical protein
MKKYIQTIVMCEIMQNGSEQKNQAIRFVWLPPAFFRLAFPARAVRKPIDFF